MGSRLGKQYLTHVILLAVMFLALLAFALFQTVREANRVEADALQRAVANVLQTETDQLALMADDNGLWDDAAEAMYLGQDSDFAWDSWGSTTADRKYYSTAGVINSAGKTRFTYVNGHLRTVDIAKELGPVYAVLRKSASASKQGVAGFVRTHDGIAVVGLANIVPVSRSLSAIVPASGPDQIVFMRPLTQDKIASLGDAVLLGDLRLAKPGHPAGTQVIKDATGAAISHLTWTPSRPGWKALERSFPVIGVGILLHFLLAIFLVNKGLQELRFLGKQALVDSLSELPNRRSLKRHLALQLQEGGGIALAMLDLDGFKAINDNFGHPVGDRLICEVAALLRGMAGDEAVVARLGGDEFAILLKGWDAHKRLEHICSRTITRFAQPFRIEERTVAVGISIGLAGDALSCISAGELMRRADVALYSAKRAGKMRFSWFDERLDQDKHKASGIETDLRKALDGNQFTIVFQPQMATDGTTIRAVEALLRWNHPVRGDVPPTEFIPVAEETGLIDRIGMWMIGTACLEGLNWPEQHVTINISAAQLRNPDFPRQVGETIDKVGFPAARLQFELSERFLVREPHQAGRAIEEIRALGISVVLDDFGSGFASAGFLRSFAFDKVKIHRSLVSEAESSEAARAIVNSSVILARALNLSVAAAGVETQSQADLMRVAGCDELQGWHFSKAVSSEDITRLIDTNAANRACPELRLKLA